MIELHFKTREIEYVKQNGAFSCIIKFSKRLGIREKVIKQLHEELGRKPTESEIQTSLKSIDESMG